MYFTLLPSFIKTHEDLKNYIEKLGLGEVENVELIQDISELTRLSYEREIYIRKFEKKIHETYTKIKKFIKNKEDFKNTNEIFKKLHNVNPDKQNEQQEENEKFSVDERIRLFNLFLNGFDNLKEKK